MRLQLSAAVVGVLRWRPRAFCFGVDPELEPLSGALPGIARVMEREWVHSWLVSPGQATTGPLLSQTAGSTQILENPVPLGN